MKKTGFTLAELVLTIAIMGIITVTAIHTFRPFDKGIKYLYSNTYYVLEKAFYNSSIAYVPINEGQRDPFASGIENGPQRLCRALIEYINPVDRAGSCGANGIITNPTANNFNTRPPMFTATNGIRFWISQLYSGNGSDFYIIYADMNGAKLPNTLEYQAGVGANTKVTKDPDIFAFAALKTESRVCPIGIAEVEPRYMTARIRAVDENFVYKYGESRTLIGAKAEAYGYYITGNATADNRPIPGEPLSYSDYVRTVIGGNSPIYSFLKNRTMRQYFATTYGNSIGLQDGNINEGGFGCREKEASECEVIIDKYVY